jgi:ubiquinone/menaquinone biosynthesis C-methylase UbiE
MLVVRQPTTAGTSHAPTAPEASGVEAPLPASHWTQPPPEEEEDDDDLDSSYGESIQSSTASVSASILEYRTVAGRRYHSERGSNEALSWIPNDEQQNESMDINHHLLTLCLNGKLFLAPLSENIENALDIGTGTGIWAIDFADQFPNTQVIATDISPIQPEWAPPNLQFEIDDATLEWTYKPNSFDYIHARYLLGSIMDWKSLFKQAFIACKPGGYLESYEASVLQESDDGSVAQGSAMDQWGKLFWEAGKKIDRSFRVYEDDIQKKAMEAAGFVDIQVWEFKAPIGGWAADLRLREIGEFAQMSVESDIEGYILFVCHTVLGWSKEEVAVFIAHWRRQVRLRKTHAYYRQRVVWGRKPEVL